MIELWVIGGAVAGAAALVGFWKLGRRAQLQPELVQRQFFQLREHLEAAFFELAASSGKPRGLAWKSCSWGETVRLARDRKNGQFVAVADVSISFTAIPGSDMEGLPAVGNLRSASALFFHDGKRWRASGRALFNLNPDEALSQFAVQYEPLTHSEP